MVSIRLLTVFALCAIQICASKSIKIGNYLENSYSINLNLKAKNYLKIIRCVQLNHESSEESMQLQVKLHINARCKRKDFTRVAAQFSMINGFWLLHTAFTGEFIAWNGFKLTRKLIIYFAEKRLDNLKFLLARLTWNQVVRDTPYRMYIFTRSMQPMRMILLWLASSKISILVKMLSRFRCIRM